MAFEESESVICNKKSDCDGMFKRVEVWWLFFVRVGAKVS